MELQKKPSNSLNSFLKTFKYLEFHLMLFSLVPVTKL